MRENILKNKSYNFAIRIVNLYKYLKDEKKEYVLSKQILRSGTAVGALVSESEYAQSKADFVNKLSIALKEANESKYWLDILKDTNFLGISMYESIVPEVEELLKLLISSIKTSKMNNEE